MQLLWFRGCSEGTIFLLKTGLLPLPDLQLWEREPQGPRDHLDLTRPSYRKAQKRGCLPEGQRRGMQESSVRQFGFLHSKVLLRAPQHVLRYRFSHGGPWPRGQSMGWPVFMDKEEA